MKQSKQASEIGYWNGCFPVGNFESKTKQGNQACMQQAACASTAQICTRHQKGAYVEMGPVLSIQRASLFLTHTFLDTYLETN